ncbi:MAG: hypothetical protein ACRDHG_13455 [Anaerolineales bacterium]
MAETFQADVGLMHVLGGQSRQAPPPGTLALGAPRRAARGRVHDFLFLNLKLEGAPATEGGQLDRLAQETARLFFGTPGSVTAALRQAINQLNQELLDRAVPARLAAATLRNENLYLAQCGPGQALLIRSGSVSRLRAEDGTSRSLGTTLAPLIQFRHFELRPDDLLVLTTNETPLWSDSSLAELSGIDHSLALDRLVASAAQDFTGLSIHIPTLVGLPAIAQKGLGAAIPADQRPGVRVRSPIARTAAAAHPQPTQAARPAATAPAVVTTYPSKPEAGWRLGIRRLRITLRTGYLTLTDSLRRAALGLNVPPLPGMFSPNLLAFTAAAVPVLVVGVSSVVYFSRGRVEQFDSYLAQAGSAAVAAQLAQDQQAARTEWIMADQWLDLAESYRESEASSALRQQVEAALDSIDLVFRLDFAPTVSGGFGSNADIQLLAASATELYAFDNGTTTIWHAWSTGRGYEIDSQFECLDGEETIPGFADPVSLVVQAEPGALGAEGVVAIDLDGTLLYCAPGAQPLTGQLATPDVGWGKLQAIEVSGNSLYVLDPVKNAVWIYDAAGGLFSGTPALYFAEEVPQLGTAVDLALALDELIILYADGQIDRCRRSIENAPDGSLRIRVECEAEPRFQDERPGQPPRTNILGGLSASIEYSPPPEPSLFFLDLTHGTVYHYSMRLIYQGQYPTAFGSEATAITIGPPNGLFVAVGDQVYAAQLGR